MATIRLFASSTDPAAGVRSWSAAAKTCGRSSPWCATTTATWMPRRSYLEIPLGLVQAAVASDGAYRQEIDNWIEANRADSEEAYAAWLAGSAAPQR